MYIFTSNETPLVEGVRNARKAGRRIKSAEKRRLVKDLKGKWVEPEKVESDRKRLNDNYLKAFKKKFGKEGSIPSSFSKLSLPALNATVRIAIAHWYYDAPEDTMDDPKKEHHYPKAIQDIREKAGKPLDKALQSALGSPEDPKKAREVVEKLSGKIPEAEKDLANKVITAGLTTAGVVLAAAAAHAGIHNGIEMAHHAAPHLEHLMPSAHTAAKFLMHAAEVADEIVRESSQSFLEQDPGQTAPQDKIEKIADTVSRKGVKKETYKQLGRNAAYAVAAAVMKTVSGIHESHINNLMESVSKSHALDGPIASLEAEDAALSKNLNVAPTSEQFKLFQAFAKVLNFKANREWTLLAWGYAIRVAISRSKLSIDEIIEKVKEIQ